jgi:RNA 2',3'-cyclic 3'-phosphodiesterase
MPIGSKRLFLALWPDQATRSRLAAVQAKLARHPRLQYAKPVSAQNFHLTLHFLGEVADDNTEHLGACIADVCAEPFTLNIDRWGYFPKAGVCWIGATNTPAALTSLIGRTAECVTGIIDDYRLPRFTPHITLFRKARHPLNIEQLDPVDWNIDHFVLVSSLTRPQGVEYVCLRDWRL